jgi:hypothetical protein
MRQGLADAVDLVIMTRSRETEQLGLQIRKPRHPAWEKHASTLEFCGLDCHARFFVVLRLDANCRESCLQQLWDQCRPDACILDQNSVCPGTSHQMFDLFADFQNGFGRRAGEIGIRLQIGKC